jgi:hypothetical protein
LLTVSYFLTSGFGYFQSVPFLTISLGCLQSGHLFLPVPLIVSNLLLLLLSAFADSNLLLFSFLPAALVINLFLFFTSGLRNYVCCYGNGVEVRILKVFSDCWCHPYYEANIGLIISCRAPVLVIAILSLVTSIIWTPARVKLKFENQCRYF